jgi:hypothetical protein
MATKNKISKRKPSLKIRVTHGDRRTCKEFMNHTGCLLATAIKRQLPKTEGLFVGHSFVRVNGKRFKVNKPDRIANAYDKGPEAFKPFTVSLSHRHDYEVL